MCSRKEKKSYLVGKIWWWVNNNIIFINYSQNPPRCLLLAFRRLVCNPQGMIYRKVWRTALYLILSYLSKLIWVLQKWKGETVLTISHLLMLSEPLSWKQTLRFLRQTKDLVFIILTAPAPTFIDLITDREANHFPKTAGNNLDEHLLLLARVLTPRLRSRNFIMSLHKVSVLLAPLSAWHRSPVW